ncbi:hypothetical protein [Pseudomonas putida]
MSTSKASHSLQPSAATAAPPALPAPVVLGLLPDFPDGQLNLLPTTATRLPLRVEFQMWHNSFPEPDAPETLTLYWNGKEVETKQWTAPVPPEELYINVPVAMLNDGLHALTYKVVVSSGNEETSVPMAVTIDKVPPILPGDSALVFPAEVTQTGLTDKYLKANDDQLLGTLAPYDGAQPGDVLVFHWSTTPGGREEIGRKTLVKADLEQTLSVPFPGSAIRSAGDGLRFAYYRVLDRPQNAEQVATPKNLMVSATPKPRQLAAPTLKEANGGSANSTLQPLDATAGATLVISASVVIEPDEIATVYWDNPGLPGAYSTREPIQPGTREYRIPADKVAQRSGYTFPLYYELTGPDGIAPSSMHTLKVLEVANLPTPNCDKITGKQLSISHVGADGAIISIIPTVPGPAWPFIATTQFTKMALYGLNASSGENLRREFATQAVTSSDGAVIIGKISQEDLRYYAVNHDLDIEVFVSFDNQQTWQAFRLLTPLLVA